MEIFIRAQDRRQIRAWPARREGVRHLAADHRGGDVMRDSLKPERL
ncbi:hypothetical protein [Paracoccus lutimaris]|nr:hypothetical protein [Paracoccus lutimaris]